MKGRVFAHPHLSLNHQSRTVELLQDAYMNSEWFLDFAPNIQDEMHESKSKSNLASMYKMRSAQCMHVCKQAKEILKTIR